MRSLQIRSAFSCSRACALLVLFALAASSMCGCGASKEKGDEGGKEEVEASAKERISDEKLISHRRNYRPLVREVSELLARPRSLREHGVRQSLIRALGEARDPYAFRVLADILLKGEPLGDWEEAALALGRIGDPRSFGLLKKAVEMGRLNPDTGVWAMARLSYSGENAQALDYLVKTFESDENVGVRISAAQCLSGHLKQTKVMALLRRAADSDPSMCVRVAAACVLTRRGDKSYWPFLKKAAADPDPAVRQEVAFGVPSHPLQEESVSLLLQLLTDENMDVAGSAWEPLEKNLDSGGPWAAPPHDAKEAREMAEAYRKAWNASRRK